MNNDQQAIFSQLDSRWARERLGQSVLTVKSWGCTITALCRVLFQLTGVLMTPKEIIAPLKFTSDGRLYWESLKNIGLRGVRQYSAPSVFEVGMLLELNYKPRHWVAYESGQGASIQVMDPLRGDIVSKAAADISGYCLIEALAKQNTPAQNLPAASQPESIPQWGVEAWQWAKNNGIITESSNFEEDGRTIVFLKRFSDKQMEWMKRNLNK